MKKKDLYMLARNIGYSNKDIAEQYNVKEATVDRAIGKNKTNKKVEVKMEENNVLNAIERTCKTCGNTFIITPAEQKFYNSKGYELPKRCRTCRENKNNYEEKVCIDCGKTFRLTMTEKEFFKKNNLYEPLRCDECRRYKRERNKEQG